jgi:hypothetical protein
MSHTPGPWEVRLNEWSRYEILYQSGILAGISKWDDPASPPPIEQMHANARLIASAPELLAALERYVAAYPAFRMKPEGAPNSPVRIEQERLMLLEELALTAIAKAKS